MKPDQTAPLEQSDLSQYCLQYSKDKLFYEKTKSDEVSFFAGPHP